jgi:ABC-2 type transport system permease protein
MATTGAGGAVYDRGYRPYAGPRGGRSAARLALWRASVRRALGLRRSWRQKVAPFTLLAIVTVPAVVNVGVAYLTRNSPLEDRVSFITYRDYVGVSSALLVFVAVVAPDILAPDRRQRVLPLLFARPLTGADYVAAKVGALTAILFAFSFLPQVLLFVGQMLVSDSSLDYLRDNAEVLWQVPIACLLLAVHYAVVSLAIACWSGRRVVGGVAFIGLFLVSSTVAAVLTGTDEQGMSAVLNVLALPLHLRDLVFLGHVDPEGPLGGVENGGPVAVAVYLGVVSLSLSVLLRRYQWTDR